MLIFGGRVNGPISTIALTRSGFVAAAIVVAPPENDWPTITAGPPSFRMTAIRSPAVSAWL